MAGRCRCSSGWRSMSRSSSTSCRGCSAISARAGRCPRPDDRPHRRQLHQHPDGQALRPHRARARLRPRRDGRVHGDRPRARCGWSTQLTHRCSDRSTRCSSPRSAASRSMPGCSRRVTLGAIAVAIAPGDAHPRHVATGSCGRSPGSSRTSAPCRTASRRSPAASRSSTGRTPSRWSSRRGEIRFENVRFHYGREERACIEDFSLTIRPGEKVGLVGRSGAGKSTLVNLLLRFYDLEGGRILIDGQDIASVTPGIAARRRSAW